MKFLDRFSTSNQMSNFIIVHPAEAEQFHVDEQTDRTKLTVTVCSCVYAPNNSEPVPRAGPKHAGAPVRVNTLQPPIDIL
jgi:hypothetical protein